MRNKKDFAREISIRFSLTKSVLHAEDHRMIIRQTKAVLGNVLSPDARGAADRGAIKSMLTNNVYKHRLAAHKKGG
jgi:hypothetical protein